MINGHFADRPMDTFTFHVPPAADIQRYVATKIPPDVNKREASKKGDQQGSTRIPTP
jgi:hypothetical protein